MRFFVDEAVLRFVLIIGSRILVILILHLLDLSQLDCASRRLPLLIVLHILPILHKLLAVQPFLRAHVRNHVRFHAALRLLVSRNGTPMSALRLLLAEWRALRLDFGRLWLGEGRHKLLHSGGLLIICGLCSRHSGLIVV